MVSTGLLSDLTGTLSALLEKAMLAGKLSVDIDKQGVECLRSIAAQVDAYMTTEDMYRVSFILSELLGELADRGDADGNADDRQFA
jgi:hypothetical protein